MNSIFISGDNFYIIPKDKYETKESLNERGWLIAKIAPTNEKEFNEAVSISRIWINNKNYGTIYSSELMNKIKNITNI